MYNPEALNFPFITDLYYANLIKNCEILQNPFFNIFFGSTDTADTEVFYQYIGYVWRKECRQRWSQMDIFNTKA